MKMEIRTAYSRAVIDAYKKIDDVCCSGNIRGIIGGGLNNLLFHFLNQSHEKKIFFTLNQDLLIERQLRIHIKEDHSYIANLKAHGFENEPTLIERLGFDTENIKQHYQPFQESWRAYYPLDILDDCETKYNKWKNNDKNIFCPYIKLHGSFDLYLDKNNPMMILGTSKSDSIKKFKLIDKYYNIFKSTLEKHPCEIMIIGYSFNDKDNYKNQRLL